MKSKKVGDNYLILTDYDYMPLEVNAKEFKELTRKFIVDIDSVQESLGKILHDKNLMDLMIELVYGDVNLEELYSQLGKIVDTVVSFRDFLDTDDEFDGESPEDFIELEDLGFYRDREDYRNEWVFTKVDDEKFLDGNLSEEITKEIWFLDDKIMYRKRIILWELTPHGRTSKSITYENLNVDEDEDSERLKVAVDNMIKHHRV